ncbi:MAG: bifunctional shikimate kinase/3-dehydroquinate synthase [Actinomycetota bacterium]|nr:bifunctional shikimate kinase/3-dehydroquinate synthase [Actinomycetota bacterium]
MATGVISPGASPESGGAVVCIGFMGAGKSTAARSAARALGVEAIDVDRVLEQRLGKPIEAVFEQDGEAAFRSAEERVTLELLSEPGRRVIALGGGALGSQRVRAAVGEHLVIWIDVDLGTAWERCHSSNRPLASDRSLFELLYTEREPVYAAVADVTVPSERSRSMGVVLGSLDGLPSGARVLWAASASKDYPVYLGGGLIDRHRFWPAAVGGRRFVVTDAHVARCLGDAFEPAAARIELTPGESAKTVSTAASLWSQLAGDGMTRADVLVALGGGVVGDLAGFCAATYQRGVRYVQAPTTLLAQVDSAYGGKTGIDIPEAKNYVGAYHHPEAVIADTGALRTLPQVELAAGYAEVVKTALIAGGYLWDRVRGGAEPSDPEVIAGCAQTKLRIVARDERDDGLRQVLNLGHTVAHAIEAVTGYARYRHGEAVALGLLAALRLSEQHELREEVGELLARHGLPRSLAHADPDDVVAATARDKKRLGDGPVPLVLLEEPGRAHAGCTVPAGALTAAVRELAAR